MARVRVPIPDEASNDFISAKAAQMIGQDRAVAQPDPDSPRKKPALPNLPYTKLFIGIAVIGSLVLFFTVLRDRNELQSQVDKLSSQSTPQNVQSDEITALQAELSKFLELPADDTPTLATVSDVEKVKDQTFFKNAQNGDKVLLYSKAGKAILYRPSTKKLIEVAPINTPTQP